MARYKDLTNQRFGSLVARRYYDAHWLCDCDCGNSEFIRAWELSQGKITECKECRSKKQDKRLIDITGQKFGYWKVLGYAGNKKWRCLCTNCNREFEVLKSNLLKGSSSCVECSGKLKIQEDFTKKKFKLGEVVKYLGHSEYECKCGICGATVTRLATKLKTEEEILCIHCKGQKVRKDIKSKQINNWIVQEYIGNQKWKATCAKCGRTIEVFGYNIRTGHSQSCGCDRLINLKDQRFGEWKVLEYLENSYWLCQCSCGTIQPVHSYQLRNGESKSCGCKKRDHIIETLIQRHNELAKIRFNNPRTPEQIEAIRTKENLEEFIQNNFKSKPTTYELAKALGLKVAATLKSVHRYNLEELVDIDSRHSSYEIDILNMLKQHIDEKDIIVGDRKILNKKELDIYIPSKSLAIEINGTYWHSSLFKQPKYHQNKSIACAEKGIRLIHVYEFEMLDEEMRDKIMQHIESIVADESLNRVIYGRKTEIREIDTDEYRRFNILYHLQGNASASIKLGCFYNNELVGIMSFGKPRFTSKYDYEIIRMCWKDNTVVIGGTQKLFKYFLKNYKAGSIITYADLDKFTGDIYKKLGFAEIGVSDPSYVWVDTRTNLYLSRYQTQKRRLVENGIGSDIFTEDEIMESHGFLKVYTSGNRVYTMSTIQNNN